MKISNGQRIKFRRNKKIGTDAWCYFCRKSTNSVQSWKDIAFLMVRLLPCSDSLIAETASSAVLLIDRAEIAVRVVHHSIDVGKEAIVAKRPRMPLLHPLIVVDS